MSLAQYQLKRRKLGTQCACLVFCGLLLPACLSSTDLGKPLVDANFIRTHALLSFYTNNLPDEPDGPVSLPYLQYVQPLIHFLQTSLNRTKLASPWYTLLSCNLYHPRVHHVVSHGIVSVTSIISLNRGFRKTLSTFALGGLGYTLGTLIEVNQATIDPIKQAQMAFIYSKDVLVSSINSLYQNRTLDMDYDKLKNVRELMGNTMVGFQAKYFGHVLYGLQGISCACQFAALGHNVYSLFYLLRHTIFPSSKPNDPEIDVSDILLTLRNILFTGWSIYSCSPFGSSMEGAQFGFFGAACAGLLSSILWD